MELRASPPETGSAERAEHREGGLRCGHKPLDAPDVDMTENQGEDAGERKRDVDEKVVGQRRAVVLEGDKQRVGPLGYHPYGLPHFRRWDDQGVKVGGDHLGGYGVPIANGEHVVIVSDDAAGGEDLLKGVDDRVVTNVSEVFMQEEREEQQGRQRQPERGVEVAAD